MLIYNCHIHTFTADHVPNWYLPMALVPLLRIRWIRGVIFFILRVLLPGSRDQLDRYANILQTSYKTTQEKIFVQARSYYPLNTRFVVLPMDFKRMKAGAIKTDIDQQHEELANLAEMEGYQDHIVPFVAVDPDRDDMMERLRYWIEGRNFRGIKIYPPLGYPPDHIKLYEVYDYAAANNLPVMAHCSRGGARSREITPEEAYTFTDPNNYIQIMEDFPDLRICMAHFGGNQEWDTYLENPWTESSDEGSKSWVSRILDIMKDDAYPNFYADISYTIFRFEAHIKVLKVFLTNQKVRDQVLFGSDFYMVEIEKMQERRLSIYLRAELGEELFKQIAETNPERYLGLQ